MKTMKRYLIKIFAFSLIVFFSASVSVSVVLAKENLLERVFQGVKESIRNLVIAKDRENAGQEELNLKRETLNKVLKLSYLETEWLKENLGRLKNLTEEEQKISQLKETLSQFLVFFQKEKQSLDKNFNLSVEQIEEKARFLKNWRTEIYLPIFQEATNFLLLHKTKAALFIAEQRIFRISKDIEILENINFIKIEKIKALFEEAKNYLSQSQELIRKAKKIETSFSARNLLLRESVNKIKQTYQVFIEMANLVKRFI